MRICGLVRRKGFRWLALTLGSLVVMCLIGLALTSMGVISAGHQHDPSFDQESWRRGYCPICGSKPDFAYLKGNGSRWLRCSHCDTEWLFQRLECPYCGNQDQYTLGFYFVEGDDSLACRVYVCEKCRHYIGAVDAREVDSKLLRTLERGTIRQLQKEVEALGYTPGWK